MCVGQKMSSILDMRTAKPTIWEELGNLFLPLKYIITSERFDALVENINFNYLVNAMFWIFLCFSFGFVGFQKLFQVSGT